MDAWKFPRKVLRRQKRFKLVARGRAANQVGEQVEGRQYYF